MQSEQNHTQGLEKPLVSFILTYYNLPVKMLCECIDSILALTMQPCEREIIVVDDGSDSSPMNDLMKYGDDIIYIRQQNKGLSEARNTGIQAARGAYLQFVDGDDMLAKAPYEHCLDIARANGPDMVVFDFTKSSVKDKAIQDSALQSGSEYMRHHNIRGTACGYLFKKTILGDLRFTPGIWHEDEEFTPQLLLRAESVSVTDAEAYLYRVRPNSIITDDHVSSKTKRLNDMEGIILRLNTMSDRMPTDDKTALQRRVAQLTMDYLYNLIRQTGSRDYLERKIGELRSIGLFPLPDRHYTTKYTWFRRLSNSQAGRRLLMRIIPLMKKER